MKKRTIHLLQNRAFLLVANIKRLAENLQITIIKSLIPCDKFAISVITEAESDHVKEQ
jgi:hypothetical protein